MDEPATLSVLTKRADFIAELSRRPLEKREMVDVLGYSRATVNRAIRDLEEARLVKPVDGGYEPTLAATEAVQTYETFLEREGYILDSSDVVHPLNHSEELPSEALVGAEFFAAGEGCTEWNASRLREEIEQVESARLLVSSEEGLLLLDKWQDALKPQEQDVELFLDEELYASIRTTRQSLTSLAAEGGKVTTVDSSDFFVALLGDGDEQVVYVLVYDPEVGEFGALRNETEAAIDWARGFLDRLDGRFQRVDDELETAYLNDRVDISNGQDAVESVPQVLEGEGFIALTEQYFDSHEPRALNTALRTGLSLADVREGHAIERVTADGDSLAEQILSTLRRGRDCAVTGEPGNGKSTLCKVVAHEWYDRDLGAVIYRESGRGAPFESLASLRGYLRRVERDVLVVVEDAMRPEANKVFRIAEEFEGWDGVHFLFDARESEWNETRNLPVDASLREYQQDIDEIRLESPDGGECQAFMEKYQGTTGRELQTTGEDLVVELEGDDATSGGMFLLAHTVCLSADPLVSDDSITPTRLIEDVQSRLNALVDKGSRPVLRAAMLSQFLNVTEMPLHEEFFHAVSLDDSEEVDVVAPLKEYGLVFEENERGTFLSVHNQWSKLFVEEALELLPDSPELFGEAVNSALRLAADESFREDVTRHGSRGSLARRLKADATKWADDFVQGLFRVGEEIHSLAPYYGRFDDPTFEIRESCSPGVVYDCGYRRAKILGRSGKMEESLDEYQTVIGSIYRTWSSDRFSEQLANCIAGVGMGLRYQGWFDAAEAHVRHALRIHQAQDNRVRVGDCLLSLGQIANYRSQYDEAAQYYGGARDAFEETGAREKLSNALGNLAVSHADRGNYDEAENYARESLEIRREIGFDLGIAQCYNLLARAVISRGETRTGLEYHRDSLAIAMDLGNPEWKCTELSNLGRTSLMLGHLDDAEKYLRRGLDVFEDRDDANTRYNLARTLRRKGKRNEAKEHAESGLKRAETVEDRRGQARCRHVLGEIARTGGDYEAAREQFSASIATFRELGLQGPEVSSQIALGRLEVDTGNLDAARDSVQAVRKRLETGDSFDEGTEVALLRLRAALAREAGETSEARRLFDEAEKTAAGLDDSYMKAQALIDSGRFAAKHRDETKAEESLRRGLRIACEIGAEPLEQEAAGALNAIEEVPAGD
ncbi:tetratricopeptide repeat protein [Halolamina salifodinae]|uniref:Tetratricopeptide (TPR) repeat protein n=1 Tax=Halolamina salifodinae TaxID=1202767 RepID=A0A8T4GWQ8_9EURY|nr:tetratricopeptide repeat protein [Halolamina salifodinae]MBP1986562.1 tetratricopeptide (TPR) repeat protein [Halolamina salifodinae]